MESNMTIDTFGGKAVDLNMACRPFGAFQGPPLGAYAPSYSILPLRGRQSGSRWGIVGILPITEGDCQSGASYGVSVFRIF